MATLKRSNVFQEQQKKPTKENPYAQLKGDVQLPSINKQDKDKMGKSMKRRMSIHQSIDLGKQYQQQLISQATPQLPTGIIDEFQQKQESHQYPGLPQTQLENELSRKKSQRSVGSLSRRPSLGSIHRRPSAGSINKPPRPINAGPHPSVPPVPIIPNVYQNVKGIDLQDQKVIKLLNDPEFDAEKFISTKLSDSTATDIERFNTNLIALNRKINNDMKQTANQTYERLLTTSNYLKATDQELKLLRSAITELMEVNSSMQQSAEKRVQQELDETSQLTKSKSQRKMDRKVDRSSILVLEKIWANEMNSLFKHVEGAQKFIAPIPGRHVIVESGRWYELNAATFKTLQPAHIFLLNDLILIATRKRKTGKRTNDAKTNLIADQCWPLREVSLREVKSNSDSKLYAINITYNSLSYIYQTDRLDHYQNILNGYKKARDELRDILEAENIKQRQLRDSMTLLSFNDTEKTLSSKRKSLNSKRSSQVVLQDLSTKMHSRSRSLDNSNNLKTLKQIDDSVDDVDVLIFHENFSEAIDKLNDSSIELKVCKTKCNQEELLFYNVINLKINVKRDEILKKLINQLTTITEFKVISNTINNLLKLNQGELAENLFLINRSSYIDNLISRVTESQDLDGKTKVSNYITEVSIVKFQNIKTTVEQYKKLFHDNSSSLSFLAEWGLKQTKAHIELLKTSLNNLKLTKGELESCILILHRQAVGLKSVGLDVEFLLDDFYKRIDTE